MRDEDGPELSEVAFERLYAEPVAGDILPRALAHLYAGDLDIRDPCVYANFVTSLDGVTALEPAAEGQGGIISGGLPADRFLMGLLRAYAGAVLIGAGTLRAESKHFWTPERVFPDAAAGYRELRSRLGLAPQPRLAVVTASGNLDLTIPALAGALIITTDGGAAHLGGRLPPGTEVTVAGSGPSLAAGAVLEALRQDGHRRILTEGGPHLFGDLLAARLVDELFLTLSPVVAGPGQNGRALRLAEGPPLLPQVATWGRLTSARRSRSHLFLRYDLRSA
ncbi:MAG: dihydrofolate reductase family protein [Candidatus Dormibacteraceae bacterium]